jgi:glycosyltransferase involved in cell wall biosynthesis
MASCVIVVPCYNEAQRLDLRRFIEHAARHDESFLFVNDGSTDVTRDVLDDLCAANREAFSALHLSQNGGKAEAVRRGMLQAFAQGAELAGYWDADLATPLEAIADFRQHLTRHPQIEMVMGARVRLLGRVIERRTLRHCLSRLFATAAAAVLRLPVYDTQCGAKLFRATPRVQSAFTRPFRTRWIFDVELLARLLSSPGDGSSADQWIHELPLEEWRDVAGSKVKPSDFLRAVRQLADIYRHYPDLRRRRRPSRREASHAMSPPPAPARTSDKRQGGIDLPLSEPVR